MNLYHVLTVLSLGALAQAADDNTKSASPTFVYVTVTSAGKTVVTLKMWTQTFMLTATSATASVPSGTVGLGSLSGSVGGLRSYVQSTISGQGNTAGVAGGAFFAMAAMLL